jgi:hypothetical protein
MLSKLRRRWWILSSSFSSLNCPLGIMASSTGKPVPKVNMVPREFVVLALTLRLAGEEPRPRKKSGSRSKVHLADQYRALLLAVFLEAGILEVS